MRAAGRVEEGMDGAALARRIDLAYLKADGGADPAGLRGAAEYAREAGLRGLCLPALLAPTVKKHYPTLRVCAVVAYPLGLESLAVKVFSAQELIEQQVDELDVVLDLFALSNDNWRKVELEAKRLSDMARASSVLLKAIIETPILTSRQIRHAAELLCEAGVACIKTSTGYQRPPTQLEHVELLRQVCGTRCLIKASGGIRTLYDAQAMLDAGADILGVSDPRAILAEALEQESVTA
jgi:deoxyribose-phosphate aldolase